jgi:hypothetical protein
MDATHAKTAKGAQDIGVVLAMRAGYYFLAYHA